MSLIVTSSAIDKMFEIFGPIFEQNANVNFEPIFVKSLDFQHLVKLDAVGLKLMLNRVPFLASNKN